MKWKEHDLGKLIERTETVDPTKRPDTPFTYVDVSGVSNQTFTVSEPVELYGKDAPSRARKLIRSGDVLFATVRPTLKRIAIVPDELNEQVASTGYFVLRPKEELNNKFLFYYLLSDQFQERMETLQKGASYPAVTDTEVKGEKIPVPPLPEQQRIVGKLDTAFAALAEAQAHVERNRANARELFESYLNGVFEGKDWKEKPLADLTSFFSDGDWIESKDQSPEGIRLVQTGNIGVGEYRDKSDKARFISEATFKRLRCTDVLPGDCLVSRLPEPVGRACQVPNLGTRMITGVDCSIIRFDKDALLPEFFIYYTRARLYLNEVAGLITGTTRARISRTNLGKVIVRYPAVREQRSLLRQLDELKDETQALETTYAQKLTELEGLKKAVLGAAFRGEL